MPRGKVARVVSEPVEYYRNMLTNRSWYAEGLSWTVIQPAGAPVTVEEVSRRLRAEPINLDEIRFPHVNDRGPDDPSPFLVAHLAQVGADVVMFQDLGSEGARREVLRWLSDRARVHNVDWTINGNGGISYAVYGTLVAWIDKNDPDRRGGTQPDALDDDLADLAEARRLRDAGDWPASRLVQEAAAMATVERRTGIRLPEAWMDGLAGTPWETVMLGRIPNDPCPPSRFGRDDPDLDACLRGAPETVQRAAIALALRRLVAAFVVSDETVAAAVIDAVERGAPVDSNLSTQAFRLYAIAPRGDRATAVGSTLGRQIIGQAFHDAIARPHGDPLDSLRPARAALAEQWPQLRRELRDLISTRGAHHT